MRQNKNRRLILLIGMLMILILLLSTVNAVSSSINVDVIETKDLDLFFVPINDADFEIVVNRNVEFLEDIYPVKDNGINIVLDNNPINATPSNPSWLEQQDIRFEILNRIFLSGQKFTNGIGVVKDGYFSNIGATGLNFRLGQADIILIDETQLKTLSHEVSHTFDLCEEYSFEYWDDQDGLFGDLCPNGDLDNDGSLDEICYENNGCPTSTFIELFSDYGNGSTNLRNIMGGSDTPDFSTSPPSNFETWVSTDSFNALLERFDINSNFKTPLVTYINHPFSYIITRIFYEKNSSFEIINFYQLESGFINNASVSEGNFSIELLNSSGGVISNISFEPNFVTTTENGTSIEINRTFLIFALPTNESLSKIVFKNSTYVLGEVNRTINTPSLEITSNLSDKLFSNEMFNVTWNVSDLDGDELVYAILFSSDGGSNYTTLEIDYNQTDIILNSSNLPDCTLCRIKTLATDGINTNSSVSETFSINNVLQSKLYIKDSGRSAVAWFGDEGDVVLKGECHVLADCTQSSSNLFVIGNSTDSVVAYINSTGDLCVEKGSCSSSSSCIPSREAFKIRNESQEIVSYIDFDGELCFIGGLYENTDL